MTNDPNKLELTLELCCKLLARESKVKKGVRLNNHKLLYADALEIMQFIRDRAGLQGCFSIGICQGCKSYIPDKTRVTKIPDAFGTCKLDPKKQVTFIDTCDKFNKGVTHE